MTKLSLVSFINIRTRFDHPYRKVTDTDRYGDECLKFSNLREAIVDRPVIPQHKRANTLLYKNLNANRVALYVAVIFSALQHNTKTDNNGINLIVGKCSSDELGVFYLNTNTCLARLISAETL
ncbi:hypothetical protein QGP82_05315 [Leptothoe sp. LEGE 181152]|nr:hypothetical protein [Leptothoe sp. LEGE 181152]